MIRQTSNCFSWAKECLRKRSNVLLWFRQELLVGAKPVSLEIIIRHKNPRGNISNTAHCKLLSCSNMRERHETVCWSMQASHSSTIQSRRYGVCEVSKLSMPFYLSPYQIMMRKSTMITARRRDQKSRGMCFTSNHFTLPSRLWDQMMMMMMNSHTATTSSLSIILCSRDKLNATLKGPAIIHQTMRRAILLKIRCSYELQAID